jgi:selenocysteine-specific elongation factor
MSRDLILGTAGHIDHGKTLLVKALTGVDCDRLPEEKRRGITIDIGFADLDLGEYHVGIVDVPGHERFIKNMLAGATGIDLAMLIVAADDSVMPQTREHLAILELLNIRSGVIALTKCDLVDDTTRAVAEMEIRELVSGTFLAASPIVHTSAFCGQGMAELKEAIRRACAAVDKAERVEWFRMAIDRAFVVQGHGAVVTGSVVSGELSIGSELDWHPSNRRVRVRSLQNHGVPVASVRRGMRAAINLAGVDHRDLARGQELATPEYLAPSRVVTVQLNALNAVPKGIKHRASVRLYAGTAEVMGTVSLLEADRIEAGGRGLAQLFLDEPITTVWNQPFIVRDASATRTLGGGHFLQPVARKIRRRHTEAIARLKALTSEDVEERARTAARFAGTAGFAPASLVRDAGLAPDMVRAWVERSIASGEIHDVGAAHFVHQEALADLQSRLLTIVERFHAQAPMSASHDRRKVEAQLMDVCNEKLVALAVDLLLQKGELEGDHQRIARRHYRPKLSNSLTRLKDHIIAEYLKAGLRPPKPADFSGRAGGDGSLIEQLYSVCLAEGHVVPIRDDVYLHPVHEAKLRDLVVRRLAAKPGMTTSELREILQTGRKLTIVFCEYLDALGITRRDGDRRYLATGYNSETT